MLGLGVTYELRLEHGRPAEPPREPIEQHAHLDVGIGRLKAVVGTLDPAKQRSLSAGHGPRRHHLHGDAVDLRGQPHAGQSQPHELHEVRARHARPKQPHVDHRRRG